MPMAADFMALANCRIPRRERERERGEETETEETEREREREETDRGEETDRQTERERELWRSQDENFESTVERVESNECPWPRISWL